MMQIPSAQQQHIIDQVVNEKCVVIDCLAGSGKTTMCMFLARNFPNYNILLLTYSKKLKFGSREKASLYGLDNIEIHSFHSFAVKYYSEKACNNIKEALKIKKPKKKFAYNLVLFDEMQDVIPDIYSFLLKILKDNGIDFLLGFLGDGRQTILKFMGADERYLKYAPRLFNVNLTYINCELTETFRIPIPIINFINRCVLKTDKFISNKNSNYKPRYLICKSYNNTWLLDEIKFYFSLGYKCDDIFIMAPTLRSLSSPARNLANELSSMGIQIYYNLDEESIENEITRNKLTFLTIHNSKGLENKVCILLGFDNSYFKYFNKDVDPLYCPNELYVGITRSLERLTVVHFSENEYLPFLNIALLPVCCDIIGTGYDRKHINQISGMKPRNFTVTDLVRYLPDDIIEKALMYINITVYNEKTTLIPIDTTIYSNESDIDLFEGISNITGIAIPAFFEYKCKENMKILEKVVEWKSDISNKLFNYELIYSKIGDEYRSSFTNNINSKTILYLASLYDGYYTELNCRVNQIKSYDWLSEDKLDLLQARLAKYINNNSDYEITITHVCKKLEVSLHGSLDCICDDNMYEFKCVKQLQHSHILQTALYIYLIKNHPKYSKEINNFYLFNILDEQIYKIDAELKDLQMMFELLVDYRTKSHKISDSEFLKNCELIQQNYL